MATLTSGKRAEVWKDFMSDVSQNRETFGAMTKTDLRAAVDAIDSWVGSNAASLNSAIPQPARSSLTARQKAWLLHYVIVKRFTEGV